MFEFCFNIHNFWFPKCPFHIQYIICIFPDQSSINSDSPRISQTMNYCLSKNNSTFNHHSNFIIIFRGQRKEVKLWAFIICFEICTNIVRVWEESIMSFSYRNYIPRPLHFYTCGFSDLEISSFQLDKPHLLSKVVHVPPPPWIFSDYSNLHGFYTLLKLSINYNFCHIIWSLFGG